MSADTRHLPAEALPAFLTALAERQRLFAPIEKDGLVMFDWVTDGQAVLTDGTIPRNSPKEALLPRTEVLFYYRTGKDSEQIVPPPAPEPQVLFGLHPADIAAVAVLDAVFSAEPSPDKPYLDRRAVTTIIGLAPADLETPDCCFYEAVGISSADPGCSDIFLTPLDDGSFVAEFLTDKGRKLADCCGSCEPASPEQLAAGEARRTAAAARVTHTYDSDELIAKLDAMFDDELWSQIACKCVGCGACAFLCPTCHCFDITEESRGGCGARVRNWDTCQFSLFTKHASGHNPRDEQTPRCRQRIMHKFDYGTKNFDIPFCVGCGRCIVACPANNDIRDILDEIKARPS
jgi:sulfhydrogenase subunit beta (sulfur reductase)